MRIEDAKKELYSQLRNYAEVTGAGIGENRTGEYIVIYLTSNSKQVLQNIPSDYKGNKVKIEVRSAARAL